MSTDPELTLAQWFSPGFPIGAFAYSHGLEWVISTGEMKTAQDLADWVEAILLHGTGRSDAILLGAAYDADDAAQLEAMNALCLAFCVSNGRRIETSEQGAAFCRTLRGMGQATLLDMAYPVAVGRASRILNIPLDMTTRFYLHAFAANLVSAAVRLVPLGQTEGQKVLLDLHGHIVQMVRDLAGSTVEDLHSSSFAADIASMQQETLYSRSFRS